MRNALQMPCDIQKSRVTAKRALQRALWPMLLPTPTHILSHILSHKYFSDPMAHAAVAAALVALQ